MIDGCQINIDEVIYRKSKQEFVIIVENLGNVDCWVDIELGDIFIDQSEKTIGSTGSLKVEAGKKGKILIEQEMSEEDLEKNKFVNLIAYYGEREDGLVKVFKGRFELKIQSISFATIGLVTLIITIIIALFILFFLFFKKRKDKDEDEW